MADDVPVDPDDTSTWGDFTPSTKHLNDMVGVVKTSRRLTPEEIELLIKSKQELAKLAFATITRASTHKVKATE